MKNIEITFTNGTTLNVVYSVLETLAINGYKNGRIGFKGYGTCIDQKGEFVEFTYK